MKEYTGSALTIEKEPPRRNNNMKVSYKRLWKLLIDRRMRKKELKEQAGLSPYVMTQLGHDRNVNTQVLCRICSALDCRIEDIVEFIPEKR